MYDIGRGSDQEEGAEKHSLCHCPSRREVRNQISECLGKWEQRAGTSKDWKVATRHQIASSERRHWEDKSRVSPKEGSLKSTRAGTPVEGFRRTNWRSLGNIRPSRRKGLNRPGSRSTNCEQKWKTMGRFKQKTLNEAELDLEIKTLREGEGRRGSKASQSDGCCFDSAFGKAAVCNPPT